MPISDGLTGAPRRLLNLASALRSRGLVASIATERDSELFKAAQWRSLRTVEVESVKRLRSRHGALLRRDTMCRLLVLASLAVQNFRVLGKIREHNADIVWIRSSKGIAFAGMGALLSRRPLVWDIGYEMPSRGAVHWLHRLGLWLAKRVVFQYSAAPDTVFGQKLAARYQHKFQTVIPGIDLEHTRLFRAKRNRRVIRQGESFVILQVGTICNRKNQQLLVDALARVREARPNHQLRLRLAGRVFEQDYADALKRKICTAGLTGEVELLGWREDVFKLMAGADIVAMPSRDEGVPNTVQEAMAIGVTVAVSSVGGLPEIVSNGETGWVIGVDDPQGWAERIIWCLDNRVECSAMGQRGSRYAMRRFGSKAWSEQYRSIFLSIDDNVSEGGDHCGS